MVQQEPNLLLTLKHLAPSGVALSTEVQAALEHSLPLKRYEAGLKSLAVWGRLQTRNGKDYLIAEGNSTCVIKDKEVQHTAKYYLSQDGARWVDLPDVDAETSARAGKIRQQLSGDPGFHYTVQEQDPAGPGKPAEQPAEGEEGEEGEEGSSSGVLRFTVLEIQRVRAMIASINALTAVVPKGCVVPDAQNILVPNKLFSGVSYPDKLESYQHRSAAPAGPTLAADVRGCWALHWDSFRGVAVLRSLLVPGYCFYYHAEELHWGGFYQGDGMRNNDLIFML